MKKLIYFIKKNYEENKITNLNNHIVSTIHVEFNLCSRITMTKTNLCFIFLNQTQTRNLKRERYMKILIAS